MKTIFSFILIVLAVIFMSFTLIIDQDKWVAPASSKDLKNPFTGEAGIAKGQAIYATRCVICHGEKGEGDGPAGKALTPPAASHTSEEVQSQTDGELYWKVSEGRGAMVGWKLILSEEERWSVVNYIRTLKK